MENNEEPTFTAHELRGTLQTMQALAEESKRMSEDRSRAEWSREYHWGRSIAYSASASLIRTLLQGKGVSAFGD